MNAISKSKCSFDLQYMAKLLWSSNNQKVSIQQWKLQFMEKAVSIGLQLYNENWTQQESVTIRYSLYRYKYGITKLWIVSYNKLWMAFLGPF